MESKIIIKEPCAICDSGKKSAEVDTTKSLDTVKRFKEIKFNKDLSSESMEKKHTFNFIKRIHTIVLTQDLSSENLVHAAVKDCSNCGGDGYVEKTFNMTDALTAMLTSALQDPNFTSKNADLLKKLTGSGSNGSST